MNDNENTKISVITICYNAEKFVEKTVQSVIRQSYENIEYIVVDGNSTDDTMGIVSKYKNKISKLVSEPDKGIYDAMNKGIDLCTGEWCLFLNCGDYFFSDDSVKNAQVLFDSNAAVIYGNTEYRFDYGREVLPPRKLERVMDGAFCCHQSAFFKTEILRQYKYDLTYRIVADWVLFRSLYMDGLKFQYINTVISSFDNTEGASTANSIKSYIKHQREKARCMGVENEVKWKISLWVNTVAFMIRRRFNTIIPQSLYKKMKKVWIHIHQ